MRLVVIAAILALPAWGTTYLGCAVQHHEHQEIP
jgi:hypothetical protein